VDESVVGKRVGRLHALAVEAREHGRGARAIETFVVIKDPAIQISKVLTGRRRK
jgi:hypothetical protein